MNWIHNFQLFLFDFDGLLVNTEPLHYQAYVNALAKRGHELELTFANFQELAHFNATAWREAVCMEVPGIDYEALYKEKKAEYRELLGSGKVELMPGAKALLEALHKAKIQRCVVTHSGLNDIIPVRNHLAPLQTIEHWITRESYDKPKPNPECYLKAIQMYGKSGDKVIGFEDSVRGLRALQGTPATAVLICPKHHPLLEIATSGGGAHFERLDQISF